MIAIGFQVHLKHSLFLIFFVFQVHLKDAFTAIDENHKGTYDFIYLLLSR
jgi:hypothetical protein